VKLLGINMVDRDEEEKQAILFFTLLIGAALFLGFFLIMGRLTTFIVLLVVLAMMIVLYQQFPNFFTEVKQYQRAVVFRMGKYRKVAEPGWLFVIPFIESFKVVDMRERMIDLPHQPVVTEDNIELDFNLVLYLKVTDAKKSVIEVEDYREATKTRAQARLRGIAGNMKMTEIVSHIERINKDLFEYMQKVEEDWGVTFTNVEIREVNIPEDIQTAVQDRRAASEEKTAKIERARGKKGEIDQIREAADELGSSALQYYYLQTLQDMSEGKSSKIIFPVELTKLAGDLSKKLTGVSMDEAQDELVDKYEEMKKQGKDKDSIIKELRKEMEKGKLKKEIKEKSKEE